MINKLLLPKAYTEVIEILKFIPEEEYKKLPSYIIENMKKEMDKEYKYEITYLDDFNNLQMLKETETILAILFRDYWATPKQRKIIIKKQRSDLLKLEEEKRTKYPTNNLFKKSKNIDNIKNDIQETSLVEYKNNFFTKLKNFILCFLNLKS